MTPNLESSKERGIILVSVLWIVALLSLLVSSLTTSARTSASISSTEALVAQLELAADAAVEIVVARLNSEGSERWNTDGRTYNFSFDKVSLSVSLQRAKGLIDLNTTRPEELSAALAGLLSSSRQASELQAYILSRREQTRNAQALASTFRTNDGENVGSEKAVLAFRDIGDLENANILDAQTRRRLRRYLTVFSGAPTIDKGFAPEAIRRSLATLSGERDSGITTLADRDPGAERPSRRDIAANLTSDSIGEAIHVSIKAATSGIRQPLATSVVVMIDSSEKPYRSLSWNPYGNE